MLVEATATVRVMFEVSDDLDSEEVEEAVKGYLDEFSIGHDKITVH